jgi:hypothetical protein
MATKKSGGKITYRAEEEQKVSQMGFPADVLRKATPKVRELTVRDLNDLASAMAGLEIYNPKVKKLQIDDLNSLEEVFKGSKDKALGRLESVGRSRANLETLAAEAVGVDVSCCCCTPCCCCAATEVNPFAE